MFRDHILTDFINSGIKAYSKIGHYFQSNLITQLGLTYDKTTLLIYYF